MPYSLYACLQDEDKIVSFVLDADTGQITRQAEAPIAGVPSVLAISPDRRVLYVGHRTQPAISSFRIDQSSGGLTPQRTVSSAHAPTFLAPTGQADTCCPRITRAGMPRSMRSEMIAR
jgi:6-phosphogluconolactonase (cycloisomerase 2 family)